MLEETPPNCPQILLTRHYYEWGTSTLRNFDKLMTDLTGVPVMWPSRSSVPAELRALENLDLYKKYYKK